MVVKEAFIMRPVLFLFVAVLAVAALGALLLRPRAGGRGGARARAVAFWWTAATMTFAFVFGGGEALGDPGGWAAAALIAAWLVPLAALAALAHLRPERAERVLAAALVLPAALVLWGALDVGSFRDLQDSVGPLPAYLVMVLGTALAVLGRQRGHATVAGALMVALTALMPALGFLLGDGMVVSPSTVAASAPVLLAGLLFLWAGHLDRTEPGQDLPAAPPPGWEPTRT